MEQIVFSTKIDQRLFMVEYEGQKRDIPFDDWYLKARKVVIDGVNELEITTVNNDLLITSVTLLALANKLKEAHIYSFCITYGQVCVAYQYRRKDLVVPNTTTKFSISKYGSFCVLVMYTDSKAIVVDSTKLNPIECCLDVFSICEIFKENACSFESEYGNKWLGLKRASA